MAMIESSRPQGSALPASPFTADEDEQLEEQQPPAPERTPREEEETNTPKERLVSWIEDPNLARYLDQETLDKIGSEVVREYEIDENSRAKWLQEARNAMKLATQKTEQKQYPWPKASNVIFPLITQAAIEFNARTYPAIIQNRAVVKGIVWGDDKGTPATQDGKPDSPPVLGADSQPQWLVAPGVKRRRADRIGEHMSWQLLDQMAYWEEQTDTMIFQLPIIGGAVRKTYRDPAQELSESELVSLENLVWNMGAKSFDTAPRHTEILEMYPWEILDLENEDEIFLKIEYGAGGSTPQDGSENAPADPSDTSAPRQFLEQHRRWDLDGDGYPEPLVVTVHQPSGKVVRIVARYEERGIKATPAGKIIRIEDLQHYTLYGFLPNPEGGSYPVGFGHLLKPLNEAINTSINQMFDAGHLANTGGGFYGTGLSMMAGPMNFSLGEYKPVNTKGQGIRDSIFPIPWPGPNQVLFQLLGFIVQEAKGLASTQNILGADAAALAKTAPTTMLALIEQGMAVYTAIHKRIYRALKGELAKLYRLNRIYLTDDTPYRVGDEWRMVTADDYRLGGGVEPIADPTMVTDMQRLGRAGVLAEFKEDPYFNPIELRRRLLEAASIENIDRLLVSKPPPPPPSEQAELATQQAQLGNIRSQEQKNIAQAILYFSQARALQSDEGVGWVEQQLQFLRLRIEALNTQVKAADVDAKVHGHNAHLAGVKHKAQEAADAGIKGSGDNGGGGAGAEASGNPAEPGPAGANGAGMADMAPPSRNGMLPAIPTGLQGGGPGQDNGAMGGG